MLFFTVIILFFNGIILFVEMVYLNRLVEWGESECLPGHEFGGRRDHYLVHIILKGKGEFYSQKRKWSLRRGDAFLIQPGQMHLYRADLVKPWTYFWLGFDGHITNLESSLQLDLKHPVLHTEELNEIYSLFSRIKRTPFTGHPSVVLKNLGYLHLIFGHLCQNRTTNLGEWESESIDSYSHVKTMVMYIDNNFMTPIQVQDVLDFVQLERSYASRLFKQERGYSIGQEIRRRRIALAKKHLLEGWSAKETAYSCGFNDYNNFLKTFKRETGTTAGSYRHSEGHLVEIS